jgi:hypothetical protein
LAGSDRRGEAFGAPLWDRVSILPPLIGSDDSGEDIRDRRDQVCQSLA